MRLPGSAAKADGMTMAQDSSQLTRARHGPAASRGSFTGASANSFSRQPSRLASSPLPLAPGAAAVRPRHSMSLAFTYLATVLAGLLFIGSCGPLLNPKGLEQLGPAASRDFAALSNWAPLPQGILLALVLALVGVVYTLREPAQGGRTTVLPAGVTVNQAGRLCDKQGVPLPRELYLAPGGRGFTAGPYGTPLPRGCTLGPAGVLVHAASGRPVPHCCGISDTGELLSSTGEPLPYGMTVGPNSTLLAADGTLLSPDLQPVPAGFRLSSCGRFLLRPNGKPVPRGVHVGPGFRLMKPNGENLPDGVKIGPCGTIICADGTILCSDGFPAGQGVRLNADKSRILDHNGRELEEIYSLGPNGTLISPDGVLLTARGKQPLPSSSFALGPLGNLLMDGELLPPDATFTAVWQLAMADGKVLDDVLQ